MGRIAFNPQYLGDDLKLLTVFAFNFETHTTAYLGQALREVNQGALGPNVFSSSLGHYMRAARFVPFCAYFKRRQIALPGSGIGIHLTNHAFRLLPGRPLQW